MLNINNICDRIASHLLTFNQSAEKLLRPGISEKEISEKCDSLPFKLPASVFTLYEWRDGTQEGKASFSQMSIWPWYYMLPLERAIESYSSLKSTRPWRADLFPIFKSSGGDYYGIACDKSQVDDGHILLYMHGDTKLRTKTTGLKQFLEFTLACFEKGAFVVTPDGDFDMNDDIYDEVAHEFKIGKQ